MIAIPTYRGYCVAIKGRGTMSHKKFLNYISRLPKEDQEKILKAFEKEKENAGNSV